jgi:hypothetical protein
MAQAGMSILRVRWPGRRIRMIAHLRPGLGAVPAEPVMDEELFGGVVAPLTGAYAVLLAIMAAWWRRAAGGQPTRRTEGADPGAPPSAWTMGRCLAATAAMGAAMFMAIMLVFSYVLADQREAIAEALTGGGVLLGISLPLLFVAGLVERRLRSRRRHDG